jgi:hypothetical protein
MMIMDNVATLFPMIGSSKANQNVDEEKKVLLLTTNEPEHLVALVRQNDPRVCMDELKHTQQAN